MRRETVTCPHCGARTTVTVADTKTVEQTTVSRTAVGILPKPNLLAASCPDGHRFYIKYSVSH